jgi:hypothetical protein
MCMGGGSYKPQATEPVKQPTVSPPRATPKRVDPEVIRRRDKSQADRLRETARRSSGSTERRGPLNTTDNELS